MDTKVCISCGQDLPLTEYWFQNKSLGKLWASCRKCASYHRVYGVYPNGDRIIKPLYKTCRACGLTFPLNAEHFPINMTRVDRYGHPLVVYRSLCKTCRARGRRKSNVEERHMNAWALLQNKIRAMKELSPDLACCRCGFQGHPSAFDFHHLDPVKKESAIARLLRQRRFLTEKQWTRVLAELLGCVLLCRNCHSVIHCSVLEDGSPNPDYVHTTKGPLVQYP